MKPHSPLIGTANRYITELGYPKEKNIGTVWRARGIYIEIDEPLFQLVNYISEMHGLNSYESRDEYNAFDDPILSECVYRPPVS